MATFDAASTDKAIIALLVARDGQPTDVQLRDSRVFSVLNIAWGYDLGDVHAHVTTNISPALDGRPIDVFFTDEVLAMLDGVDAQLFGASPKPDR